MTITWDKEKEITNQIGEILTNIRDEHPLYDDIEDTLIKYNATSMEEYCGYLKVCFCDDFKDEKINKLSFVVTFIRYPHQNKSLTGVKISNDCYLLSHVVCRETNRKDFNVVHKNNKLALV